MIPAPIHEMVAAVSQFAAGALAAAVWQGMLLAGAAALGLRLLPETPARVRFAIWFAVFALIAGLPFLAPWPAHGATADSSTSHAWLTLDGRWCFWIAGVWALASFARAVSLAIAAHRVRALWKRARPVSLEMLSAGSTMQRPEAKAPFLAEDLLNGLKATAPSEMGHRKIEICVSEEVDRPTVIGFFSPRIVLPEWLLERLTPAELEHVVLHEASHLTRRDDWLNLVQKLGLVIFPLNPALAWIERRLCLERELACDEWVLRATGSPVVYAECLARIAEYRLERRSLVRSLALALGAIGRESELTRRVLSLLSTPRVMKRTQVRLVFGSAMLLLVGAAAAFERSPQLVAFADGNPNAPASVQAHVVATAMPQVRAVAVRAAVKPEKEWRTSGDAPARMAAMPHVKRALAAEPATLREPRRSAGQAGDLNAQAVSVRYNADAVAPQMFETVATRRQVTPDGEVIVTRWVTVSAVNDSNGDTAATGPRRSPTPQAVQAIAVPVQGGWLVFQL